MAILFSDKQKSNGHTDHSGHLFYTSLPCFQFSAVNIHEAICDAIPLTTTKGSSGLVIVIVYEVILSFVWDTIT